MRGTVALPSTVWSVIHGIRLHVHACQDCLAVMKPMLLFWLFFFVVVGEHPREDTKEREALLRYF